MRLIAAYLLILVLPTGCAHYYLPASQLESPEVTGPDRIGRLELVTIQSGSDLISAPSPQATDPKTGVTPDPVLQLAPANYAFGAMVALTPELDVGLKIQPYAPLLARAQYQLTGDPESKAQRGNFSMSLSGSGGLLLSTYNGQGVTFYTAHAAIIGGYRLGARHVASLAPYVCLAGLSGVGATSVGGTRYGASLGYQYDVEALILRAELTWGSGSVSQTSGSANDGGFFPGLMVGLKM